MGQINLMFFLTCTKKNTASLGWYESPKMCKTQENMRQALTEGHSTK